MSHSKRTSKQKQSLKRQIAIRSNGKCFYCGGPLDPYSGAESNGVGGELEHCDPNIKDDIAYWELKNLALACSRCNAQKLHGRLHGRRGINQNLDVAAFLDLTRKYKKDSNYLFYGLRIRDLRRKLAAEDPEKAELYLGGHLPVELPEIELEEYPKEISAGVLGETDSDTLRF